MTKDLKPCPFCGGRPHQDNGQGQIICLDCGAKGPPGFHEIARELWNKRKRKVNHYDNQTT